VVGTGYTGILTNTPQAGYIAEAKAVTSTGVQTATSTWSGQSPPVTCGGSGNNDSWYGIIVPLVGSGNVSPVNPSPIPTILSKGNMVVIGEGASK
jgi:hypothetical protein